MRRTNRIGILPGNKFQAKRLIFTSWACLDSKQLQEPLASESAELNTRKYIGKLSCWVAECLAGRGKAEECLNVL
jgi:hypothetical protein